ncbi:hypothetical protein ABT095_10950 [Kitasatospora sp. NPDC002227]|uniref:hypothetical protein n=1 Tax=Kitasatospora sp. NPDC002227 TaxID=3154773 RepID=UPI00331A16A9
MAGGEWWRVDGPWKVLGRGRTAEVVSDEGGSVYAPEVPVAPPMPAAPPAVGAAGRPPLTAADFPGWDSVVFDFSEVTAKAEPPVPEPVVPEQRGEEPEVPAEAAAPAAGKASVLAGRRPSAVALVAALVLLGGVVTGQLLALLAGWGLAYVAPRLGEWTRKFAALGIPLVTMAGSTVWYWGREKGRWGSPLAPGEQFAHVTWSAAPGVLRLAGALSAVFLLAVTLRRRPE